MSDQLTGESPAEGTAAADTAVDQPLDWADDPQMGPADTVMWRGDADRRLRSTVGMVEVYDCVPDWDRLVAAHDWGSRMAPRFRQRVIESPLQTGPPSWAVDPDFDLHYHLRRIRLGGDNSMRELLSTCEQLAMTPLDPARPPWEGYLIEGLPDGKAAYFLKAHHALTDGLGAIIGMSQLHSTSREPNPDKPQPPAPEVDEPSPVDVLRRQLGDEVRRVPQLAGLAVEGVKALTAPRQTLSRVLDYGRSVQRVAGLTGPAGSPVFAGRSVSWRFQAFEVPFASLKAAARATGTSINDVYLGGLISGIRRYHEELDTMVEAIPVAMPISIRSADDTTAGNNFAAGRLAGPVGIDDPLERILSIREQVRAARNEPAADMLSAVGPLMAWLPSPLVAQLGSAGAYIDLQASNVPGIPWDMYVAGAKVERMFPFGPLPGCAMMATLVTHNGIGCLGLNYDPAAVTDGDLFAQCLVEGFAEVTDLAGDSALPRLSRVV